MRIATLYMAVLMATLLLPATDAIASDSVYRWVDEDGNVHFGDRPPEQVDAEKINVQTSPGSAGQPTADTTSEKTPPQPSYAQKQREERAQKRRENAEKQQSIAKGCEQRLATKAQLEPSTRVMVTTEDGEVYRMDDNDRLEELAKLNVYISENCED